MTARAQNSILLVHKATGATHKARYFFEVFIMAKGKSVVYNHALEKAL
jgi:hypothetical protein